MHISNYLILIRKCFRKGFILIDLERAGIWSL